MNGIFVAIKVIVATFALRGKFAMKGGTGDKRRDRSDNWSPNRSVSAMIHLGFPRCPDQAVQNGFI
jgi:hypothetical protein